MRGARVPAGRETGLAHACNERARFVTVAVSFIRRPRSGMGRPHRSPPVPAQPGEGRDRAGAGVVGERRLRDDRVLTGTRVLGAIIVPFLLVAFGLLYLFPDDTRHWFAWDVQPTITPLIMGAGYIAGAYFFVRVAIEIRWHRIQVGFLPVTAFTLFMAIGTFNHLDRFETSMWHSGSGSGCT